MATYVFSDVHGYHRTLARLLERVQPSDEDEVWMLGDMVDRGPNPVEVMRMCRELADGHVLMGNHEDMLLDCLVRNPHDGLSAIQWTMNGGATTLECLDELSHDERTDLIDWVKNLLPSAHAFVGGRPYLLVHAGLKPLSFSSRSRWTDATMDALLRYQVQEDVLWIRDEFWGRPTGFVNERGEGPIVLAGHTPVPYVMAILEDYHLEGVTDRPARDEDGNCQVMHLGASEATGGVADRWAIDCGAAGGAGWGRICMIRLADEDNEYAEFYEPVTSEDERR